MWEKEKLLVTSNFSFSQCFQKACFPGASKGVIGLRSLMLIWLYSGFNATLTAKVISWRSVTQCVCWLSHTSTNTTFSKPLTTFLICFSRGERQKYTGKKVCLNRVSNSQPPGHESDTLTTEPLGWGH